MLAYAKQLVSIPVLLPQTIAELSELGASPLEQVLGVPKLARLEVEVHIELTIGSGDHDELGPDAAEHVLHQQGQAGYWDVLDELDQGHELGLLEFVEGHALQRVQVV